MLLLVRPGSISLLELVMPFVEVDVEHDHRARGQASHQKPGQQRMFVDRRKKYCMKIQVFVLAPTFGRARARDS